MKGEAPPVVAWYKAYCVAMALLYLACVAGGGLVIAFRDRLGDMGEGEALFIGAVFVVVSLPFLAAYAVAPFLPPRRWTWIYHLVLIVIGLSSPCCLPPSVALLIFWLKPEARAHFGR